MTIKASSYRNNCIEVESSTPIPPAPTNPNTTADRTEDSNENRVDATKDGKATGV